MDEDSFNALGRKLDRLESKLDMLLRTFIRNEHDKNADLTLEVHRMRQANKDLAAKLKRLKAKQTTKS